MSTHQHLKSLQSDQVGNISSSRRLNVSNLIARLNHEKKKEKKRNLALSVAAVSAISVFAIILTL